LGAALKHDAIPGRTRWPIAICRPGPDPLESLVVALSRTVNVAQGALALSELIAEFQKNEKTLHLIARQSIPGNASEQRLVILVDQFEEVFTLSRNEELREALINAFSQDEQELCRRTFLRLTQPGEGTEDTKRSASMQELLSLSAESTAEEEIVQKLANASLLTTEGDLSQKDAFVEVAHEALIRSWPQLRKWIDADRAGLRTRTRLSESARDWKNAGRDPAYLYTGARLAVAAEWEASHLGELSADEAKFLVCSLEAQKQREASELEAAQRLARVEAARVKEVEKLARETRLRNRFRLALAGVTVVLVLALSALWFAYQEKVEADRAAARAS
jgi:hypothetical protein